MKISADQHRPFGKTGLSVPPIMFGAAALGNVPRVIPEQTKLAICGEWFRHVAPPVFIDTSSDYGAGMALEMLGRMLKRLEIPPSEVIIGHKLGWQRSRDVERSISYGGILESWERDCRLLGDFPPQLVSVHKPDEYLEAATSPSDRDRRFHDILDSYRALAELKAAGTVAGIGVGANDWQVVKEIGAAVSLDLVMLAGSFTIMRHPPELLAYIAKLAERQIAVINSGVFDCGFLVGGSHFDGRAVSAKNPADRRLFAWRKSFAALCEGHGVRPSHACIQFALSAPEIVAVALNTSHPDRVAENVESVRTRVPDVFWESMKEEGLLAQDYPYLT